MQNGAAYPIIIHAMSKAERAKVSPPVRRQNKKPDHRLARFSFVPTRKLNGLVMPAVVMVRFRQMLEMFGGLVVFALSGLGRRHRQRRECESRHRQQ
jgi:hypothetical protein